MAHDHLQHAQPAWRSGALAYGFSSSAICAPCPAWAVETIKGLRDGFYQLDVLLGTIAALAGHLFNMPLSAESGVLGSARAGAQATDGRPLRPPGWAMRTPMLPAWSIRTSEMRSFRGVKGAA